MHASKSGTYAQLSSASTLDLTDLSSNSRAEEGQDGVPRKPTRSFFSFEGWRFGASLGALTAYAVLFLNFGLTLWGASATRNGGHIFQGNCKKAERISTAIHLTINILSTLLLGASNYAMQCLSAPTRSEIDVAHQKGRWLDIGVQSVRNLRAVHPLKQCMWVCLGVSSVPLHLFYNSMFYQSTMNHDYDLFFASEDWVDGGWYASSVLPDSGTQREFPDAYSSSPNGTTWTSAHYSTDPAAMQAALQHNSSQFERLDFDACIDTYAKPYLVDHSNLVLLSDQVYQDPQVTRYSNAAGIDYYWYDVPANSSLHWVLTPMAMWSADSLYSSDRYGWMCDHFAVEAAGCDFAQAKNAAAAGNWTVYGFNITGCVAQKADELCSINFNLSIGILVIVFNFGKAVCITAICVMTLDQPLLTVGDAIASFMRVPDESSKGLCLASRRDIGGLRHRAQQTALLPKPYAPERPRRWKAAGRTSWLTFFCFYGISILTILILLIYAITKLKQTYNQGSFSQIYALGMGKVSSSNLINGWALPSTGTAAVLSSILVANTPQALLSGLYLTLNNIVTRAQLAAEWASFASKRKGLRVSHIRRGAQRAKYFLQVPYRWSIPLMILSATLHWLVSESIFLASIDTLDARGQLSQADSVATCGFSPLGMVCTMLVGAVVIVFAVVMGLRRLEPGMPVVGSCSLGIAAACHGPVGAGDEEMPVMWGALPDGGVMLFKGEDEDAKADAVADADGEIADGDEVGHCCFSSEMVERPVEGRLYA